MSPNAEGLIISHQYYWEVVETLRICVACEKQLEYWDSSLFLSLFASQSPGSEQIFTMCFCHDRLCYHWVKTVGLSKDWQKLLKPQTKIFPHHIISCSFQVLCHSDRVLTNNTQYHIKQGMATYAWNPGLGRWRQENEKLGIIRDNIAGSRPAL